MNYKDIWQRREIGIRVNGLGERKGRKWERTNLSKALLLSHLVLLFHHESTETTEMSEGTETTETTERTERTECTESKESKDSTESTESTIFDRFDHIDNF